jgi:hypothetical protein
MDKSIFLKKYHRLQEKTGLLCPECNIGQLLLFKKNISIVPYEHANKEAESYEEFDYEWLKFGFHGVLECNHCHEKIAVGGKSPVYCYPDGEGLEYDNEYEIEYIERPPYIIKIDNNVPKEIQIVIIDSFKLFWLDINSCANKIRICLEMIMDIMKIKQFKIVNKKRRLLSLQERIGLFSKNDKMLGEILTSIKWIGNYASHNETILKNDVLDGYYLLEYALQKIYNNNNEKEVIKMVKEINKNKKPRSKLK